MVKCWYLNKGGNTLKKILYIGTLLALLLMGCDEQDSSKEAVSEDNSVVEQTEDETNPGDESVTKEDSPKEEIKKAVESIVSEDLKRTQITELTINNYQGEDGQFIVLPYLKWEVKNGKDTTVEMLEMYSDNLAAKLYEQEGIKEITIFWEVPHHLEGENVAKFNYERSDKGMAKMDKWLAPVLQ